MKEKTVVKCINGESSPFEVDKQYLFLGEIENMSGRGIFVDKNTNIY